MLLSAGLLPFRAFAQLQRPTTVVSTDPGCVLIICGLVFNPGGAGDADSTTAVAITPPLALGSAAVRLRFPAPVPAGTTMKLRVSYGGVLSLGLLNATLIRTFQGTSDNIQQDVALGTLVNLSALGGNIMQVDFPVTTSFTDFELRTGSLLSVNLLYSLNLHSAVAAAPRPLPVELTSFTGKATATGTELSWATAQELNSAYFQVERASGSSSAFAPIGQVSSAGTRTTSTSYRFVDKAPAGLYYYRLRQVDRDGQTTFSPVVSVRVAASLTLQAFPNPTAQNLHIAGAPGELYTLVNQLGQAVLAGQLPPSAQALLDLSRLPDGVYLLRSAAATNSMKVIKVAGK